MIKLWISREAALPIREQLSAQLLLGILSRRLAPGEKLPSVRELARRLKIHGNTVLAVYQDLAKRGWVRAQAGSGVFVRESTWPSTDGGLDDLVQAWIREAQTLGYSVEDVQTALARQTQTMHHKRLVVVDSDGELARVLAAEIATAIGQDLGSASCEEAECGLDAGDYALASSGQAEHVAQALQGAKFGVIHLKSMQDVLAGQQRPPFPVLIAIVSRSPSIRAWAATLLASLGFDADSVLLRDPAQSGWQVGLGACHIVATDTLAARSFPAHLRPIVFRLVSDESLAEMRQLMTV